MRHRIHHNETTSQDKRLPRLRTSARRAARAALPADGAAGRPRRGGAGGDVRRPARPAHRGRGRGDQQRRVDGRAPQPREAHQRRARAHRAAGAARRRRFFI